MRRWGLALLLVADVCGVARAQTTAKAKLEYRISGVAVSSRRWRADSLLHAARDASASSGAGGLGCWNGER